MGTFEAYQRRAISLDGVSGAAALAEAAGDLRELEAEVSSGGMTAAERRSLTFTLSSVMINLASDAGSIEGRTAWRGYSETRGMALCNLGNHLDGSGRWAEAYTAYADALEADPTNGNAAGNIAEPLRRRLGRRVDRRGHLAAVYDKYVAMAKSLRQRTVEVADAAAAAADRWDALELTGSGATCGMTATSSTPANAGSSGTGSPWRRLPRAPAQTRGSGTPRPCPVSCRRLVSGSRASSAPSPVGASHLCCLPVAMLGR